MTKKEDPFAGAEIDQDSEPLHFEEASSLFDETSTKSEKPSEPAVNQVERPEAVTAPIETKTENTDEDIYTIGAFLKQMRIEKNISLKIISQHTKISVTNLEHLEADELDALPNRAYVIGYVKSFAKALHLNQKDCLELLDVTYGIEPEKKKDAPSNATAPHENSRKNNNEEENSEANGIKIGIAIFAVAIAVFLLVLNNTGKKDEVVEEAAMEEVVETETSQDVIPQTLGASTPLKETPDEPEEQVVKETVSKIEEIKLTKEPAKPTVLATPIPVKQLEEIKKVEIKPVTEVPVKKVEEIKIEEKKEAPKKVEAKNDEVSFRPVSTSLYSDDTKMSQSEIDELLPVKYRATVAEGENNIFVNAYKADSWLTYKSDDGPIKKFILRKGRTILIRGKLVRIFLGNLGAVKVFKNNVPLVITSPSGVKSLIFPQEKANEYVVPLFIYNKNGTVQTSEEYLEENPQ